MAERTTPSLWARAWRHPIAATGLLALAIVCAATASLTFAPYDPYAIAIHQRLQPPSPQHPFGTDELGRDMVGRVMAGAPTALRIAVQVPAVAAAIGVTFGVLAAILGGVAARLLLGAAAVVASFPPFLLALAVVAALGPNLHHAMLAISLAWWPPYTRIARRQVLRLRQSPGVVAARALGMSEGRILTQHVLPACGTAIAIRALADAGQAILLLASLSLIGMGARVPVPEWGAMVAQTRPLLLVAWWIPIFPGLAIALAALGFICASEGLRDVLAAPRAGARVRGPAADRRESRLAAPVAHEEAAGGRRELGKRPRITAPAPADSDAAGG
jgi:peptide/nickel transport system permease protein